jgi:acyl-CoA dehydrogenase
VTWGTDPRWPFFDPWHRRLREEVEAWARTHLAPAGVSDAPEAETRELVARMGEAGWLRYAVAGRDWGGVSDRLEVRALCLVRETLAYHHGLADAAFALQGLGSGPISLFGTDAQRRRYLPGVASGRLVAAFALTEPEAGSDAAHLQCRATPARDGYTLDGTKTFVSNGGVADFYVVFARTGEGEGARGISAFVVDKDTPGLEVVDRIRVMAPHPLATLRFRDCWVAEEARVGAPGEGFRVAMATLDVFRTTVAAAAVGFARRALDEALGRAVRRRMFGKQLADLQLTQARLATMWSLLDASALLTYRAAWLHDQGDRVTGPSAMAKLFATESAQQVVDSAVQLWGGLGVTQGTVVEALYREVRALRIYEGASEVQQLVVARELLRAYQDSQGGREDAAHGP